MMTPRSVGSLSLGVALALAVSGCSFSIGAPPAPTTIPAGDVAALAEQTILDQFQAQIRLDCGTDPVPFEVGTVVDCIGNEVGVDEQIPVRITIVLIDGDYYEIDITSDGPAADTFESGFVASADFESVVAAALEQVVGERGVVNCGLDEVEVFLGAEYVCSVVLSSGFAETYVTVIAFEGSTYEITAELIE
ncbi:MAG: hypothetical protein KIT89_05585 [Microcella sp.]|uniref:hypothetical protein n=1 Tax=Microcella sp. TaxID=1913979 RepID=UPI0024C9E6DD|nr:hypothetical protein [Microcella sp.]UYN84642.1 MAG: hypothetical protein KIT89_05585 [Microcella sp.]